MKTPEEIKKDAETCMNHPHIYSCNSCSLYGECHGIAEHIIKELYDLVVHYESRLAQVEREKIELLKDFKICVDKPKKACRICNNRGKPICSMCENFDVFEWRGVCPENSKEKE